MKTLIHLMNMGHKMTISHFTCKLIFQRCQEKNIIFQLFYAG